MRRIEHRGQVRSVARGVVRVAIVASGACQSCRAKELCGMGESQEKIFDIPCADAEHYRVGEQVILSEERTVALRAVLIAYVGALVVLLLALVGALALGLSEGLSVLVTLAAIGAYYGVIHALRAKIEQKIYFRITKD